MNEHPPRLPNLEKYMEFFLEPAIQDGDRVNFGKQWIRLPSYREIGEWDPNLTVSIVCVNWGATPVLPPVFGSFAKQDYPRDQFEVLFVDDNSPDKEECIKVVKKLMSKHSDVKIRFFETHKSINWNCTRSTNIGIKRAVGDIIVFCESDTMLVGKDFLTATVKHHSQREDLWLNPLCYGFLSDRHRDECFETDVDDIDRRDFVNPSEFGLDIVTQPITWNGGSVRREQCVKMRGLDEGIYGWGGMDGDFFNRLKKDGFAGGQDVTMQSIHTYRSPFMDQDPYYKHILPLAHGGSDGDLTSEGSVANPDGWGEIDTLEEITV